MFTHFNKILLRTPLQSLKYAYQFSENENSILFEEGLYISSPEFFSEYKKETLNIGSFNNKKLKNTFNKYWLRSCSRCTPYGTFAGASLLNITQDDTSSPSRVILSPSIVHKKYNRLDMDYIARLINILLEKKEIRNQLLFYPNNSLYFIDDKIRYVENIVVNNKKKYQISSLYASDYIFQVLDFVKEGALFLEIVEKLLSIDNIMESEAIEFVEELISAQLLISSLGTTVSGPDPLYQIIKKLDDVKGFYDLKNELNEIFQLLSEDKSGVDHYKLIENKIKNISSDLQIPKNFLQVDMFLNVEQNFLNSNLIDSILTDLKDLKVLSINSKNYELDSFRDAFYKRFEESLIPLSIALDPELGIGYAGKSAEDSANTEFIDDLTIGKKNGRILQEMNYLQHFSLTKFEEWITKNLDIIEITEEDLKNLEKISENRNFSNVWSVMGNLLSADDKVDNNNFLFNVISLNSISSGNLLGRFAHGSNDVHDFLKIIVKEEEKKFPEAIFAEIIHLPQDRIGNILLRPSLREYEIPYVGLSAIEEKNQILIDDLYVQIQQSQIILWSKKHNKRVIPRLTTAHNFSFDSLPIYKFLCDLQNQNMSYAGVWDWGSLSSFKHLPRVQYKNLILQRARWIIFENDFKELPKDDNQLISFFQTYGIKNKIPKKVVIVQGDNELFIDFDKIEGIHLLLEYVYKFKKVEIKEFLFNEKESFVKDRDGNQFTNEIVIPFIDSNVISNESSRFVIQDTKIQRDFFLGSEWLYFKVYSGPKSLDNILATLIFTFIEKNSDENFFENFFFIRYKDEFGEHLRIRFFNSCLDKNKKLYSIFMKLLEPYIINGVINKVITDTYKRELERYKFELIHESEKIFYADSLCVIKFLNLLNQIDNDYREKYRFIFALRGIDIFLSDFGLELDQKYFVIKNLQSSFFKEFGGHDLLQKQLNDKYRNYKNIIDKHLDPMKDFENEIIEAVSIFNERSVLNSSIVKDILNKIKLFHNNESLQYELIHSYLHMYINRLFIAKQRKNELVVYHFLERYYFSKINRNKKEKNYSQL